MTVFRPHHKPIQHRLAAYGVACFVMFALQAGPVSAAIIRLKETVATNNSVLTLGDVAEVLEPNAEKQERLNGVLLGPAPAAGRSILIDYQTIRDRLHAVGFSLSEVEFSGTSHVQVKRVDDKEKDKVVMRTNLSIPAGPAPLSQQRLQQVSTQVGELISRSLAQQYPQLGRFIVMPTLTEEQTRQFTQIQPRNVRVSGGHLPFDKQQTFLLQFTDRSNAPVLWNVSCAMRPVPRVLAVRQSRSRGHILAAEDLGWRLAKDEEIGEVEKVDPELILGRQLVKNLAAESAVKPDDVELVPLVKSNDIVTVISRVGRITVRMNARCKGSGGQGEIVQVQSLDGRTRLQTRVTGYHEVEVLSEQIPQEQIGASRISKASYGSSSDISHISGGTQAP